MPSASDLVWLILATFLVLLMQCGFLLLEGGRVRAKNSINVAQKNVSDIIISWVVFSLFGFALMFGIAPPLGAVDRVGELSPLHFLFHLGFCATAASIVSGGVAERMTFRAYLMVTVLMAALVYPLAGRLVWGATFTSDTTAWLADLGFVDFSGATVVHGVGAACALVCASVVGPRAGRFDEHGKAQPIPAHNSVLSLTGVLILVVGWLGFNGGALSATDPRLPGVLANTLTAAAFGGLAGMLIGARLDGGHFLPSRTCNGVIGGLVAVTAGAHLMSIFGAALLGALGGWVACQGADVLLRRWRVDDPVDVVATHGLAGILGTLGVAVVAPISTLPAGSRLAQLAVQAVGSLVILSATALATLIALRVYAKFAPLRVSADAEEVGLNFAEHGEGLGSDRLKRMLNDRLQEFGRFSGPLDVSLEDEHSELAGVVSRLMQKYDDAQSELDRSDKRFRQFARTASDWLIETDADLNVVYFDGAIDADALRRGVPLLSVLCVSDLEDARVTACINDREPTGPFEATVEVDGEGSLRTVEARAEPFYERDGAFAGYRGSVTDITLRKAAQSRAEYLSLHDELTDLPNRRALLQQLKPLLSEADETGEYVVLAGIDLDGFKKVNDSFGHQIGDGVLVQVAERIRAIQRSGDLAFRTGGDEFVVAMTGFAPDVAVRKATDISNRLIEELSRGYDVSGSTVKLGASVGIAVYPINSEGVDDLTRLADLALYAAKSQGKGRVVRFEARMDLDAKRRAELEADLPGAVKRGELALRFQPLIELATQRMCGMEALVRWHHPRLGLVSPVDFISLAEKLGVIHELGEWVLTEACEFVGALPAMAGGRELRLAVNVSPLQLSDGGLGDIVRRSLRSSGLSADRLELELTEEAVISDLSDARETLNELRALGVGIAIDDFGSGQTSLQYLSKFPLTKLKIDRSFIRHLGTDLQANEITRSVVTLGRSLGVRVIAEGVEEPGQLELLRAWQCDEVQGYLLSKPLPPDEMTMLVQLELERQPRARGAAG